jgi:hypothetical protein
LHRPGGHVKADRKSAFFVQALKIVSHDPVGLTTQLWVTGRAVDQDVWPIWGTSFYVKHGDAWMWSGGINVLAGADWATTPAG